VQQAAAKARSNLVQRAAIRLFPRTTSLLNRVSNLLMMLKERGVKNLHFQVELGSSEAFDFNQFMAPINIVDKNITDVVANVDAFDY
jgi:hypothetical protein